MGGDGRTGAGRAGSRWRAIVWTGAVLLLLAPAVAMRFTDEVKWTGFDFAVFGAMLVVALGALELGLRIARTTAARTVVVVAVLVGFLLAWAQGAVGIFGR